MNRLLQMVTTNGPNLILYAAFLCLGFVVVIAFNLYNCKNYHISRWKALVLTLVVYVLAFGWMFVLFWAETGFRTWGGFHHVRVFVWLPIIVWPVSKLLKLDWVQSCDFVAPCLCINHGIGHLGCIFAGCCNGYSCSWGMYNPSLGYNTFPIQLIESITALLIAVVVWQYERKKKFEVDGLAFPLMLMLFGYTRFLFEFFRDNNKLFWGISSLALHALFAALVGTIAYIVIKRKQAHHS